MKLVYAVNYVKGNRSYPFFKLERELRAQIENSRQLGWAPEDILVMTNFDYEFLGVKAIKMDFPKYCLTGSKVFAMEELFKRKMVDDIICCHDLDAWQVKEFECPDFRDIGISTYSTPKFNGGVLFYRPTASEPLFEIANILHKEKPRQEEPTINKVLKSDKYQNRVTVLHNGFNLGCSGFVPRMLNAHKNGGVIFGHYHPNNRIAMSTHLMNRNNLGKDFVSVTPRLHKLLERYFFPDPNYPIPPLPLSNKPNTFKPDRTISSENPGGDIIAPAKDPNSEVKWPFRELTENDPLPEVDYDKYNKS